VVRLLVKDGFVVQVIMTRGAMEFVTPLTFQTLSGMPVATETFNLTQESEIGHINLADSADLFVIAPATANVIGKIAAGIADDLLTTVLMATQAPVLIAPAMNIHMYANPILQENIRKLRRLATISWNPPKAISHAATRAKGVCRNQSRSWRNPPLAQKKIWLVRTVNHRRSKSGTVGSSPLSIEPVVRKDGICAGSRGTPERSEVLLVSGPTELETLREPSDISDDGCRDAACRSGGVSQCTAVIMAAAVSDYRPVGFVTRR
jgi:phosphopantothenoylcysteine decarboxylase/phosphopantothenate--cysteine ligase